MATKQLEISVNEKDVENIYRQHLSKNIWVNITIRH